MKNIYSKMEVDYKEILINKVNYLIKEYENTLDLLFQLIFEEDNSEYKHVVIDGIEIIELIAELILIQENFTPSNTSIIEYVVTNNITPKDCEYHFLQMTRIKHELDEITYLQTCEFLKSFEYILTWFDQDYMFKNFNKYLNVEKCLKSIISLQRDESEENFCNESKLELLYIHEINESLKKLVNYYELMTCDNYASALIESRKICKLILELYLIKENYIINKGKVLENNEKNPIIPFIKYNRLLPDECLTFLNIVETFEHNYNKLSYNLTKSFLVEFSYFLLWFNNYYSERYTVKNPFKINKYYFKINSEEFSPEREYFLETLELPARMSDYDLIYIPTLSKCISHEDLFNSQTDIILSAIYRQNIVINEKLNKLEEKSENIESKLDEIYEKINTQILSFQSLIKKQIQKTNSPQEIEIIIEGYIDECAERLINETNILNNNKLYKIEKKKLINSLGRNAWNKLSENSKTFLISSKLMYNNLICMDEKLDYSGVCILVTKALEVEINKRFCENFIKYLNDNYNKNYSKYHTALLYKNKEPLHLKKFTMGRIAFVMCYKFNKYDTEPQKINNKEKLIEYCKECVFSKYDTYEIESMLHSYASSIEEIRTKYRNKSAHAGEIKQIDAENCFNLLIDIEKLLKKMLDSFDY